MPAFKPDDKLSERVSALLSVGFARVIVVDDGSGVGYREVFGILAKSDSCDVLRHETNKGKGAAIKTALTHVLEKHGDLSGVVTVDADGQHSPEDCRRVAESLLENPSSVVLGVRDFNFHNVPFRSWWGNTWTKGVFAILYGRLVPDTQTGLRGFGRELLARLITAPGTGYEYEMSVLCRIARSRIPFSFVPIRTIYENDNASSHFHPLRDTIRIYRVIFGNLFSRL